MWSGIAQTKESFPSFSKKINSVAFCPEARSYTTLNVANQFYVVPYLLTGLNLKHVELCTKCFTTIIYTLNIDTYEMHSVLGVKWVTSECILDILNLLLQVLHKPGENLNTTQKLFLNPRG